MKVRLFFSWMNIVVLLFALVRIFIIGQIFHYDSEISWPLVCGDLIIAFSFGIIMTFFCNISRFKKIQKIMEASIGYTLFVIIMFGLCMPALLYVLIRFVMKIADLDINFLFICYGLGFLICIAALIEFFFGKPNETNK